jgi:type II restriction/modification system DNA methylase subunit YeeA
MIASRQQQLEAFLTWSRAHIKGDEKGEAQIFLDHLFRAFGHAGLKEAGATCEERIKREGGNTAFADLVWRPHVLIEMKKRGEDLSRHYRQAFDYWTRLVPGRPRYVVLCNFDDFWIYDFETQMDTPVDTVPLVSLPSRYGPLAFLFPTPETPIFGNHQESVTREAADKLASCFNSLAARGLDRTTAQLFTLQALMALFAQDIGLLEKYVFTRLLEDCQSAGASYDLIGGLFEAMNNQKSPTGGRFKGVPYFNGGLFSNPARLELVHGELQLLREAACYDWARVRPEIFGTIFEHSLDGGERHAFGAYFTSASDIMKIVGPTIVEPWRAQIETAATLNRLNSLLLRIENFRVLDPACGSGNFLYMAYRELKRLEARIQERMAQEYKSVNPLQRPFGFVTARNFFGLDINPFAIEIAKVTMMLAHKLAIDELHVRENALPLDNLDQNFAAADALIDEQGREVQWPKADVIIGNPPFLGAKRLKPERGTKYVNAVRRAYPGVPGLADYCVYWFQKSHRHLTSCTEADPFTGRAGLVGTQNVRNNQSRVGGLDQIVADGTITEAVDNQPWSGEANVHVSIVNWVKSTDPHVLPKSRTLWSTLSPRDAKSRRRIEFTLKRCETISSSLSCGPDISGRVALDCNRLPKRCFQGKIPGYEGFLVDKHVMYRLVTSGQGIVVPYLTGRELLGTWRISRWASVCSRTGACIA